MKLDKRKRRLPNDLASTGLRVQKPKTPHAELFEVLHWIGMAPTAHIKYLFKLNGRKSEDATARLITRYVSQTETPDGDTYLTRPDGQWPNIKTDWYNRRQHLVHDLGLGGINYLKRNHKWVDHVLTHTNHWEHHVAECTAMWEFYLGIKESQHTFVPHHRTFKDGLQPTANEYKIPLVIDGVEATTTLKPDAHFVIDYGISARHIFFEMDMGTKQKTKIVHDKSTLERHHAQYRALIVKTGDKEPLYKSIFNTTDPALVIYCFNDKKQMELRMKQFKPCSWALFSYDERMKPVEKQKRGQPLPSDPFPPMVSLDRWYMPYKRIGHPDFYLCKAERQ